MKKTIQLLTVGTFVGFLGFMGYQTVTKEPTAYSEYEYRNLSQRPNLTVDTLASGDYMKEFETYFQDQFYKRIGISKYFYALQIELNKPVVSNVLIGKDGWASYVPGFARSEVQINQTIEETKKLNDFALANDIPLYLSINPYKDYTLAHVFPYHPASFRGPETKREVIEGLDEKIQIIDNPAYFKDTFSHEELETMFYKTDHHWNYLGAYEAYKHVIHFLRERHEGIPAPAEKEQLKTLSADRENVYFIGSTNRSVLRALNEKEEAVSAFTVPEQDVFSEIYSIDNFGNEAEGFESVFHTNVDATIQSYGGLTSGDFAQIIMKTKTPPNNYKVLVIKDSYTNAMFPYMATHFAETHILDMRHYKEHSVEDYVKEHNINMIILSHNETMVGDTFKYSGNLASN